MFASLLNGAALAVPVDEDKADIRAFMAFVERHQVTMISSFPYLLADMNHLPSIPFSLRLLISGGDVLRGIYKELSENLTAVMTPVFFVEMKQIPLNVNGEAGCFPAAGSDEGRGVVMDIQIREATIQDIDLLMQWQMQVLHEVFIPWEQSVKEREEEKSSI
ncbi:hypothetical protein [uncultured Mailhella sp.]|uniref:hypothetical protein n=1 Tax=uncultured Mailhella sp. TaxID=1981031 RepID=UPI0025EF36BF|nr:hypothetical protein [uncultured Mailhella sp.]